MAGPPQQFFFRVSLLCVSGFSQRVTSPRLESSGLRAPGAVVRRRPKLASGSDTANLLPIVR